LTPFDSAPPLKCRHLHLDLLVLQHALEVDVDDLVPVGVALDVLEHRGLLLAADLEREDGRVEALVVHQLRETGMVDHERARIALAPVEDRRDLAEMTQAAARTLALVFPELGVEFKGNFHVMTPVFNPRTAN